MVRTLENACVVITGASSGIGRATALAFAAQKANVVLAARAESSLNEVARECEAQGARALVVPTDVADAEAVEDLADQAVSEFGGIDIWINGAAVTLLGRIDETPYDAYRRVIEVDLLGCVHGARSAIAIFREQKRGVLINISSVAGKVGQPFASAYVASKFGVVGLSESLREELRDYENIHVCTVFPATVDTPLFEHAANYTGRAVRAIPPVSSPEDVAEAIVNCALNPRREVSIGGVSGLVGLLHQIAPAFTERRVGSKIKRQLFGRAAVPPTRGNVSEPQPETDRLHGGWEGQLQQRAGWPVAATAAVLGAGMLMWMARGKQGIVSEQRHYPEAAPLM